MKWKTTKYKPAKGDKRRVRKFAFLPTNCGFYTVWMESYESHQEYMTTVRFVDGIGAVPHLEWVEFERNHLEIYL